MLGGYPQISRTDLQGSHLFFQKVRRLYASPPPSPPPPPEQGKDKEKGNSPPTPTPELLERGLDVGAGIGRVTSALLSRLCITVDVVESQPAFAAQVPLQRMRGPGRLGDVYVCGIEEWLPKGVEGGMHGGMGGEMEGEMKGEMKGEGEGKGEKRQYDLVWAQWCLGYLRDEVLVTFLSKLSGRRGGSAGTDEGDGNNKGYLKKGGWIIVKENVSTSVAEGKDVKSETVDVFDELDSSVTRSDATFRRCFQEAGLRVVRSELQKGFEKGLLPVKFYALRVEEGG